MCTDIVVIRFGIATGQISSIFDGLSAHLTSVFSFPNDSFSKNQWVFTNFVCVLILWRSGLILLLGKFHQFMAELSACNTSIFSFPDDNMSKYQRIFTKRYLH